MEFVKQRENKKKRGNPNWQPGKSGNPKGRPRRELHITEALKRELQEISPADRESRTWAQLIVEATLRLAIKGHSGALKEIWDRIDGKVKENVSVGFEIKVERVPALLEDGCAVIEFDSGENGERIVGAKMLEKMN